MQKSSNQKSTSSYKGNFLDRTWLAILVFVVGTTLLGFLASVMGGRMNTYWNSWTKPPLAALPLVLFIVRMAMYWAIGIAVLLVYGEKSRRKYNRSIDLILFYTQLALVFFFPLFFFGFGLFIFATIWLGMAIVLAIITLVRFWANNLIAGSIYTAYTLWLMYLFYLSLGVTLLA